MQGDRQPAFLFFPRDFEADSKVAAMTPSEVGAYILLICKAWFEDPPGSVPDDDRILAKWAGMTKANWLRAKPKVMAAWQRETYAVTPESVSTCRWFQKRLCSEYMQSCEKAETRTDKAIKAANIRWQRYRENMLQACPEHATSTPQAMLEPCLEMPHQHQHQASSFPHSSEKEEGHTLAKIPKPKKQTQDPSELAKRLAGLWYDRCLQWGDENAKRMTRENYLKKAAPLWDKEIKINPAMNEKTVTDALNFIERHHGTSGFSWKGKVFSATKLLVGDGAKWPTILNQSKGFNGKHRPNESFRDRGILRGTPEQEAAEARLIAQVLGGAPDEEEGFGWPE